MIPVKPNSERHYADLIQSQCSGFWYHRYSKPPGYEVEKIAATKGYLPVFNVFNPQDAAQVKERLPRALKWAERYGLIALKMNFWPQDTKAEDLWNLDVWKRNLNNRFRVGGKVVMVFLDCEPPLKGMSTMPGTDTQIRAATEWIAEQEPFDVSTPEIRKAGGPIGSAPNLLYSVLPRLGMIQVNQWTYAPKRNFSWVAQTDIIGLRVGDGTGNYSPQEAMDSWPGRMKFIFPAGNNEADELKIVNAL